MGRDLGRDYLTAARSNLRAACSTDHPPRLIGASFGLGLFLLALPNLGASVVVIAGIAKSFTWANPQALSAAIVVLNPFVKGLVYMTSVSLGTVILGPFPGVFHGGLALSIGPKILIRLLLGNLIIAVVVSTAGSVIALYSVRLLRSSRLATY